MYKHKIVILICYMGKLPWYFDYFLHSCSFNLSIDFYIITDDLDYNMPLPNNVKFCYKTLNEFNILASEKLNLKTNINSGYKICDIRPAFAIIFPELVYKYDFWGFGDIDVIYGNIRGFITEDLLENYELISVRPDFVPGCFTLYKNSQKMNSLYLHSKDYKIVFESERHYCFDECNFAQEEFTEGKTYHEIHTEIESMMHVYKKLEEASIIKPFFDLFIIEGLPGGLYWNNGMLIYGNKFEVLFYHLIKLKKIFKPPERLVKPPNNFKISSKKIY